MALFALVLCVDLGVCTTQVGDAVICWVTVFVVYESGWFFTVEQHPCSAVHGVQLVSHVKDQVPTLVQCANGLPSPS